MRSGKDKRKKSIYKNANFKKKQKILKIIFHFRYRYGMLTKVEKIFQFYLQNEGGEK